MNYARWIFDWWVRVRPGVRHPQLLDRGREDWRGCMVLSGGWAQALAVVLLMVPGLIYQGVRSRLRGPTPDEVDTTSRVLRAVTVSAGLALLYLLLWPDALLLVRLNTRDALEHLDRATLLRTASAVFGAPVVLAVLLHTGTVYRGGHRGRDFLTNFVTYSPVPTAWDFAASNRRACFIRVLTGDNTWIGGYAGENSFVSAFPQQRDLYVEIAYEMDRTGAFIGPVEGSAGMWISCSDAKLLQLVEVPSSDVGGDSSGSAR